MDVMRMRRRAGGGGSEWEGQKVCIRGYEGVAREK